VSSDTLLAAAADTAGWGATSTPPNGFLSALRP